MSNETLYGADIRLPVSRLIARYFLVHLQAEVLKPDWVLLEDYPELPVRQMYRDMIVEVRREFGIAEADTLPTCNLFRKWCEQNGKFEYDDSGFIGYSRTYYTRILDLRDGTTESRGLHYAAMKRTFDGFDYENRGFTVAFFLDSEFNMRELMREAVRRELPEYGELGDDLVLAQSRAYQTAMYNYFEGVLKQALAENVRLLNGILPQQVANELKRNGHVEPVYFTEAAVLFTDFEGFSRCTEHLAPADVIQRLDTYFTAFDEVSASHGLEKIKTIGDSYMAVAGVPESHAAPVRAACDAALAMIKAAERVSTDIGPDGWRVRVGIHVGPLVAGVIGRQKFSYDVWGATVNFASRMEASSEPGHINVSSEIYNRVKDDYEWTVRGARPVKGLGMAEMYFLLGRSTTASACPAASDVEPALN